MVQMTPAPGQPPRTDRCNCGGSDTCSPGCACSVSRESASTGTTQALDIWPPRPVMHPRHYTWFVFLSSLDLMFTWVLLLLGGAEVNPIADAVLQHGGLPSLTAFKFSLVILVIVLCEWATRRSPRTGFKLAEWSVAITAIPVVISGVLLWHAV